MKDHYGTYSFEVVATDSKGYTASDRLDISVQQHKQIRAVNHEFHLYLKIAKKSHFPKTVDWQLEVRYLHIMIYRATRESAMNNEFLKIMDWFDLIGDAKTRKALW